MGVDHPQQSRYERLRSWYLANLRRRAINEPAGIALTPAALIAADREMVEMLIAGRARQDEGDKSRRLRFVVYGWLSGIAAIELILFLITGTGSGAVTQFYRLTIGLLVSPGSGDPLKTQHSYPWYNLLVAVFFFGWPLWWFVIHPIFKPRIKRVSAHLAVDG